MTNQGNGWEPVVYRVVFSERTKIVLRERLLEELQTGTGEQFVASMRSIVARLRTNPLNFGEPCYRLPALKLLVCQAVVSKLIVDFAVHETRPFVFIREVRTLS